ncbi:hypothetical protein [Streptomyces sp. NPDC060031]|uniref:hypothetical protein n=1 Tax=Streptomyces sp. NPDC060031 TaxID=3347043 RepID=UPI0036A1D52E
MTEAVTHPAAVPPDPVDPLPPEPVDPLPPFRGWRYAAEAEVYRSSVEELLVEPAVADRLQIRPEVTADAVRAAMQVPAAVERVLVLARDGHEAVCSALDERSRNRRRLARARAQLGLEPATAAALLVLFAALFAALVNPYEDGSLRFTSQVALTVVVLAVGVWLLRRPRARRQLRNMPTYVHYRLLVWATSNEAESALRQLAVEFTVHSARRVLLEVIEALLGEDPHSVLMYDGYHGLRARRDSRFFVRSACASQLARKLSLMDGGTIALSGPRGVGKTTLLDAVSGLLRPEAAHSGSEPDLVIRVAVPAAYTPYDFLLSCLIGVCEQYLRRSGQTVPDFTRLSGLVRLGRRTAGMARSAVRWLLFALPAGALLVLGAAATVRVWWGGHRSGLMSLATGVAQDAAHLVSGLWHGQYVLVSLMVAYTSFLVWGLRTPGRFRRFLGLGEQGRAGWILLWALGWLLAAAPILDGLVDVHDSVDFLPDRSSWTSWTSGPGTPRDGAATVFATLLVPLFVYLFVTAAGIPRRLTSSDRTLVAVTLGGLACIGFMATSATTRPVVFDAENPGRLAVFMLGLALVRSSSKRRGRHTTQTDLTRRCLNQLFRLRTVQGTSAALNFTPGTPFGSAHGSTLSSVPPNFPQLVAEFLDLVGAIAEELGEQGDGRVFLCIDELDRMATPAQARMFLGEVKAILGVPRVYCLVSVAEDISAGFVRRGMPHRDTTDSAFDDIVHVRPMTPAESVAILEERVPGLPRPYAVLAHALSGGIPRDLIRYALGLVELRQSTPYVELCDIALVMLAEELSDTLAGFRTLLAAQPWTAETAPVMVDYRLLTERLDDARPEQGAALVRALQEFAAPAASVAPAASAQSGPDGAALPETTRPLVAEARAYAACVLTLLQIFTPAGFDQRSAEAAVRDPDGSVQRLADMRLELAVSPYSALVLVDRVRRAWGLPVLAATPLPSGQVPSPERS